MDTPTAPKRRASEAPTTPGLPPGALGTVTALNGLPAALASIGIPTTPAAAKRPRVTDRQLPADLESAVPESRLLTDLQEFERKLDATILRKRLELQEAKGGSYSVQRTLRMFISNTVAHQAHQLEEETPHDTQAPTTPAVAADAAPSGFPAGSLADTLKKLDTAAITVPSWTLKIEGRLLELPYSKKTAAAYKFTSFFESVAVELIRDPTGYPGSASSGGEGSAASQQQQAAAEARESQITEWRRTEAQPDMDGFEIKRCGDVDVPLRIILTPRPLTNRFRLSVELARVLGFLDATGSGGSDAAGGPAKQASAVTMTQLQVITHLWQYIRNHNLQSPVDPQRVVGDATLQKLLGAKEWSFPFVSHLLRPHLLPPEPIVIEYT
ncbi:SWI/SNF and RSC complex subunit Ssr3, partial [Tieghemiomyces parasiticus]